MHKTDQEGKIKVYLVLVYFISKNATFCEGKYVISEKLRRLKS